MNNVALTELLKSLSNDTIMLTVNRRLADHLRQRYAKVCAKTVWPAEWIMPLSEWVAAQWQRLNLPYTVLNTAQHQALWQTVISEDALPLLRLAPLAKLAMQTYQYLQQWQVNWQHIPTPYSADVAAFVQWLPSFEQRCLQHYWVVEAQLVSQLTQYCQQLTLPKEIILIGFEEFTPQLQALMTQLVEQHPIKLTVKGNKGHAATPVYPYVCPTPEAEWRTALHWAKQQAEIGKTVAIVVPNLLQHRKTLKRLAVEILTQVPYIISGGEPLIDSAMISTALAMLRFQWQPEWSTLSTVLLSPFTGNAELEQAARYRMDLHLRNQKNLPTDHAEWQTILQTVTDIPQIQTALAAVLAIDWPSAATAAEWAQRFSTVWSAWNFAAAVTEVELQILKKLQEALQTLRSLQLILPPLSAQEAYQHLHTILATLLFQGQDVTEPQIEILGILEAGGLPFDGIWLCGLSSEVWPPIAHPTPFLPVSWQRRLNMPHASATRELQYAEQLFQELRHQCDVLYCSYPQMSEDITVMPSPLLARYGEAQSVAAPQTLNQQLAECLVEIEPWQDTQPLSVSATEQQQLRGGAAIFKSQSLCPFQAFATVRLKVPAFPEPIKMLDLRLRGILLHEVLEQVWRYLKNQKMLVTQLEQAQWQWLHLIIEKVLQRWQQHYPHLLTTVIIELELQRLMALVQQWLALEAQRSDFTVLSQEKEVYAHFAGIPLHLRLDRIDQLANGDRVIIDYKTGKTDYQQWFEDRPAEVQLPLYAVLNPVSGAVFAELRPEQVKFSGITAQPQQFPGVKTVAEQGNAFPEWSLLQAHWSKVLTTLADQFLAGDARVDPLSPGETCRYCHLQRVCRVQEINH